MTRLTAIVLTVLMAASSLAAQNAKKGGLTGWDYFKQKHYDVALELLEKDHRFYPKSHEILDGIGWCKYFLGDFDGAEAAFKEALNIDADYRFSKMGLESVHDARLGPIVKAEALLEQGNLREAANLYRDLLSTKLTPEVELRAHRGLGQVEYRFGDYQASLKEFQKAIRIDKKDAGTSAGIGYVQYARRKYSQADIAFEAALESDPSLNLVRLTYGWSALLAGNPTAAMRRFEDLRKLDPRSWAAAYGIGWTFDRRGEGDKAIASFREALSLSSEAATAELRDWITRDPARSSLLLEYGFAVLEGGNPTAALQIFQTARGAGDRTTHLLGEALARLNTGDSLGARQLGQAMLDHQDDPHRDLRADQLGHRVTVSANSVLGWAHLRLGEIEEAREAFTRALDGQGHWADAWCGLGWVELAAHRYPEAEARFARSLELLPAYAGATAGMEKVKAWRFTDYDRAWSLITSADYAQARTILEGLRRDQAGRFPADRRDLLDYSLGEIARRLGKSKDAVLLFESALDLNSKLSDARVGLGRALIDAKEFSRAAGVLEQVMPQLPDDPAPRQLAAWALIMGNETEKALEQLAVWTRAFPNDAELAERYGRLLFDRGQYIEARIALQTAVAADINRIPLSDLDRMIATRSELVGLEGSLGWALLASGRYLESIARFEKAIAAEGGATSHLKGIALAESAAGHFKEAAKHAEEWIATLDKSAAANAERRSLEMTLGWDLYGAGEAKAALDRFKEVEKREGDSMGVDVLTALGWTWLKMDKALKAREYFLKALAISPRLESALQGLEAVNEVAGS